MLPDSGAVAAAGYGRPVVWVHSTLFLGRGVVSTAVGWRISAAGARSRLLFLFLISVLAVVFQVFAAFGQPPLSLPNLQSLFGFRFSFEGFVFLIPSCFPLCFQSPFPFFVRVTDIFIFHANYLLQVVWCVILLHFFWLPASSLRSTLYGQVALPHLQCLSLVSQLTTCLAVCDHRVRLSTKHQHGRWLCWV